MASIILKTLKPENIRKGVTILKTTGTFEGTGPAPVIINEDITVDSSTVEQQFQAGEGYTGLGTVTVNPYVLDTKSVNSSTSSQTVNSSADGMSSVTVNSYTLDSKTVDSSTVSQTVTSSADGLSSVTVNPYTLEAKTVDPSTSSQTIVSSSTDGLSSVTLNAVTSSIDSNISAENIKQGVTILGVTGTMNYDSDWILAAKTGGTTIDTDTDGLTDTSAGMRELFQNTALTSVTFRDTTMTGANTLYYAFKDTLLQSLSFPNLTTISASNAMRGMCVNTSLTAVSMPKLKYKDGAASVFYETFTGISTHPSLETTPEFFKSNSTSGENFNAYGSVWSSINFVIPEGYTYSNSWNSSGTTYITLKAFYNVTDANILDMLQKLGSVSDYDQVNYTVHFAEARTIQDNADGDYTAAVSKLTTVGWTVSGLTITP